MLSVPSTRPLAKTLSSSKKVLCLWTTWTLSKRMLFGKRQRGAPKREGVPQEAVNPSAVGNVVVAAVRSSAAFTRGLLDQKEVDMLVDSGSSISLIQESVATAYSKEIKRPPKRLGLTSADGKEIPVIGCITLPCSFVSG